jgi:hypothetical protein
VPAAQKTDCHNQVDFTKALDTIDRTSIIQMMKHQGFDEKWLIWTSSIMSTATTSVLLNGVPGKSLTCKRGVIQGDPMSPLLFILAADLLQCTINKAHAQGLIQLPIPTNEQAGFPVI